MRKKMKASKKVISKFLIITFMLGLMINFPLKAYGIVTTPPAFSGISLGTSFGQAIDVIFDSSGNLYIADYSGRIIKTDKNGQNSTIIASGITGGVVSMAFDDSENLYVTEDGGHKLLKIDSLGNVTQIATVDSSITGIVLDGAGHMYLTAWSTGKIYKMNIDGSNKTDFVTGMNVNSLFGLEKDNSGNLYFADKMSGKIKKVDIGGTVTDFATGLGAAQWMTIGKDGYFYVSDSGSRLIRKIDTSGNIISSFATGTYAPWGLAVNECGYIYFTSFGTNVFKIVGSAATSDPTHIVLTINTTLLGTEADPAAFTVHGVASNPIVTSAVTSGAAITLTLSSPMAYGENSIKIDYAKTGTNNLTNSDAVELEAFAGLPVINQIPGVLSVASIANKNVVNGTTQGAIGLPQNINVTLSNSTTTNAAITWDNGSPAYNGNSQGTYTFTGTLTLPEGVTNPSNRKASVNVIVGPAVITSVTTISNVNVAYGTTASSIGLPSNVVVDMSNGVTTSTAITWDNGDPIYNMNSEGVYVFTGVLSVPAGASNPSNMKAKANVVVGSAPVTTSSVISVVAISDIAVANGTAIGSIGLPNSMTVSLSNASTTRAAITWDNGTPVYTATAAGTYVFSGTLTLPNGVYNPGNLKARVNVIVVAAPITPTVSGGGGGGSSEDKSEVQTRIVEVVAGNGKESGITPVMVQIVRTVENGVKIDTVKLDEAKTKETITKAIENKKDTATIFITDLKDNKADKVEVQISKDSSAKLSENNIGLKIDSEKVKLELPKETLKALSKDIKLDISEIREADKVEKTKAVAESLSKGAEVLGTPIEISTNYSERTQITIPLSNISLPKDPQELKKVLSSLAVLIEHSDGENLIDKGEIKYDEKGNAIGIAVWVNKFSTFTVVGLPVKDTQVSNSAGIPEIKFVGLGHSPLVEGDTEEFTISSGFDGDVQYRIYLNVNGVWKEVTNGYSSKVSGKETFSITPDYKFEKGLYQGRVYVKKAGIQGSKEENGIDFDNYYTYNINCVDRDDTNRVYTTGKLNINKDNFNVGEKVSISGIEGIKGIEGPYFYRLHVYDVANDKWTNNVIPYSSNLDWTPLSAGTYVLDLHVITPNSTLWNNVQNDPTLIYGGYEGWKLKTINVSDGQAK